MAVSRDDGDTKAVARVNVPVRAQGHGLTFWDKYETFEYCSLKHDHKLKVVSTTILLVFDITQLVP